MATMRARFSTVIACLAVLSGCAPIQHYGEAAAAARRQQNDLQARATVAAACDVALASYWRELTPRERQALYLLCAPASVVEGLPMQLTAPGA